MGLFPLCAFSDSKDSCKANASQRTVPLIYIKVNREEMHLGKHRMSLNICDDMLMHCI